MRVDIGEGFPYEYYELRLGHSRQLQHLRFVSESSSVSLHLVKEDVQRLIDNLTDMHYHMDDQIQLGTHNAAINLKATLSL